MLPGREIQVHLSHRPSANHGSGLEYHVKAIFLQLKRKLGAPVPAEYACFRMTDQLFSRIGNDDSIETNASSFMVECKEINHVLQVGWISTCPTPTETYRE
jgi:DNA mismatch repair protein MSH4